MVISLAEMKGYLRVDFDDDDDLINTMLAAAENRCRSISRNPDFDTDPNAKTAILYMVAYMYEHREDKADNAELNRTISQMLYANREAMF